jgi:putative flippase GtrA
VLLVRFVPERWRGLARELMTFGIIGVVNTLVDFVVLNLFLPIGPVKAKTASTIVATTVSYFLNRHWTYKDRDRASRRREYTLFFAFNLVGFVIQSAVLAGAKYGLGFDEHHDRIAFNVANAVGIALAMVFRFWSYRTFVFGAPATIAEIDIAPEPTPGDVPAQRPVPSQAPPVQAGAAGPAPDVADEFVQLTAELEAELDGGDLHASRLGTTERAEAPR